MPKPLDAKHPRPGSDLTVRVEVPRFFNRDDAARALALEYPEQSPVTGERGVRDGLSRAARRRVLDRPGVEAPAELVEAYKLVMDKHWRKFFKYDSSNRWVGSGDPRAVRARFDVGTLFSRREAALALALVYERVPVRVGRATLERGLRQAADQIVLARADRRVDEEVFERFWELLGEIGPWSEPPS